LPPELANNKPSPCAQKSDGSDASKSVKTHRGCEEQVKKVEQEEVARGAQPKPSATARSTPTSETATVIAGSNRASVITALPPPDPAGRVPYGQDASQYTLTFADEFDTELSTAVWNDYIWYEAPNPTKNYAVEDGVLKIWPQRDASGNFFNRTLDTDGRFAQTYGYFEIEARLTRGKGTWPAFWLFNHIADRRPEIDILEAYPGGEGWGRMDSSGVHIPDTFAPTVWPAGNQGENHAGTKMHQTGMDLSAGFHKYALKWEPNRQTFYFDGKEVLSVNVSMGDPMYLLLDLWFGSASGTPDDSTPQGKNNAFEVNYVRVWAPNE
jgi:beta-glucanase (GH16 family)